jgi:hypothetical protein
VRKETNRHRRHSLGVLIVLIALMGACSSRSALNVDPSLLVTPQDGWLSPTPFQPGGDDFLSNPDTPTPLPTATPLRNIIVEGGQYPTPLATAPVLPSSVPYLQPGNVNPLTGLVVDNPELLNRRPMAIKVTNYPRYVRPQSGLTLADVVFEYYIEDGLTRFIAVLYGNDAEWVGPVRSGRYFDEHVERMYHAFLVFKYADPREYGHFKESDFADYLVVPSNGACPPFRLGKNSIDTYNNIFFNTTKLADCIAGKDLDNSRPNFSGGFFYNFEFPSTTAADRIYTSYTVDDYNYWEYNPDTERYYRYQETDDTRNGKPESYAPLSDALTGEPVTADNVVVLFVPHNFANQWDQEDEVYHIDLLNSGNAYIFRNGLAVAGKWYRQKIDQPLLLTDQYGIALPLHPGRTFYEVIGQSSISWHEGSDWHFVFHTP